jgi:Asp-tRNA(Asn)/Glu-tRNA(Gln) amidotransferase A subunit family amidase
LYDEVEEITIAKLHEGFRERRFTARAIASAYLERIQAIDRQGPGLNAITEVSGTVLREAEDLDAYFERTGSFRGPLHGVTVIIKDQIETAGLRTTYGSTRAKDNIPERDATVVDLLKGAGALILAKSTLPDFATSWFSTSSVSGLTKNPYALDRDPGGSSSGTAAAVAANLGLVGIGEDTGGSIRLPASFTNLIGIRPTVGLVSTAGVSSFIVGTDTIGPMTRTVEDAARILDVLSRADPADPLTALVDGHRKSRLGTYVQAARQDQHEALSLGLVTSLLPTGSDEASLITQTLDAAVERLRAGNVSVVEVELPGVLDRLRLTGRATSLNDLNAFIKSRPGITAGSIEEIYEAGDYHNRLTILERAVEQADFPLSAEDRLASEEARRALTREIAGLLSDRKLDALIYPDVQALPPLHEAIISGELDSTQFPTNTLLASGLRFPAISVPAGFTRTGLPVGLELLGLPLGEGPLLRAAARVESVVGGRQKPSF